MQKIKKIRLIDSGPRIPDGGTDGRGESDNPPKMFSKIAGGAKMFPLLI